MAAYTVVAAPRTYTFRELAYAAEVPFWRLHMWRRQGLISPPSPRLGRGARYSDLHLREIALIREAQERRVYIRDLSDPEVRQALMREWSGARA